MDSAFTADIWSGSRCTFSPKNYTIVLFLILGVYILMSGPKRHIQNLYAPAGSLDWYFLLGASKRLCSRLYCALWITFPPALFTRCTNLGGRCSAHTFSRILDQTPTMMKLLIISYCMKKWTTSDFGNPLGWKWWEAGRMFEGGIGYTCPVLTVLWASAYGHCWVQSGLVYSICLNQYGCTYILKKTTFFFPFSFFFSFHLQYLKAFLSNPQRCKLCL